DVLICLSGVVLEKLNRLVASPTHRVYAGVYHEADGAPHVVRELAKSRVGIFVKTQILAETFRIERPAFDKSRIADVAAKFRNVVEFLAKGDLQVMAGDGFMGRRRFHFPFRTRFQIV